MDVPRAVPKGLSARIEKAAVKTPAIFRVLQEAGAIPERDMFNTFNMGVGMALIVSKETADAALDALNGFDLGAYVVGEIAVREDRVQIC